MKMRIPRIEGIGCHSAVPLLSCGLSCGKTVSAKMKGAFKKVKGVLDYKKFGGAPLLGTAKIVIKCHGNSKANSIATAIEQVVTLHRNGMIENISEAVQVEEQ